MRTSLRWLLCASLVLTGAALWRGEPHAPVEAVVARDVNLPLPVPAQPRDADVPVPPPLPRHIDRVSLSSNERDLMAPVLPPVPLQAPAPVAPVLAIPAPPPPPLAMPYRFFGRLVDPEGHAQFFVVAAEQAVAVHKGEMLDESYRVDEVTDQSIHLLHVPTQHRAVIPVPAEP